MEQNNKLNDFENSLKLLETISETFVVDIWIPSIKNYLKFKEIDAKQQKNILNASMKSSVYNTEFIKEFYKILNENLVDKTQIEFLNNLSIFDKAFIILALKSKISDSYEVMFDEKNDIKKDIMISDICAKSNNYEHPEKESISLNNILVDIQLPTIQNEFEYELELHKSDKKLEDIKDREDIQNIVTDAFIGETSKYIKNISINELDLNFNSFSFMEKIKIVERLPSGLIQKILEKVSVWKKNLDTFLTIENEYNGEKYTKVISPDNLMFLK